MGTCSGARLDRALCNMAWRIQFEEAAIRHIPAVQWNHSPIMMHSDGFVGNGLGERPFRFQAAWLLHEEFQQFLANNWDKGVPLNRSLTNLTVHLQEWNKKVFGTLFQRKKKLWRRLEGIQRRLCGRPTRGLILLERKLKLELEELLQ